jgi:Ca-activated chloride channel family protein
MKAFRFLSFIFIIVLAATFVIHAQGPETSGSETVAKPKKKGDTSEPDQAKIPSKFPKKDSDKLPDGVPVFSADATTVTVDVAVMDNKNHFIPGIGKDKFRVLEDNVPQKVSGYSIGEAPMTICMVIEFSNKFQSYYSTGWYETLTATYGFVETLKKEDYLAIVAYDLRPEILSDFSTDRRQAGEAMQRLRVAAFSEANMYDALIFTGERMQEIEGRKAIVLITSGIDTFSKVTFDQARRKVQDMGVPIYSISMLQAARIVAEQRMGAIARMDFLQADNTLRTFSKESGGMAFFPRFFGEFPSIFQNIAEAMRNQYVLTYTPSNQTRDGKFRKIKVELINPETNEPVKVVDEKGKPIKYQIFAKAGYTAPRVVE